MAEIFTRKFSEVSGGRFDPEFYIGQTIQIVTYPLKNFVKIKSGKRIQKVEAMQIPQQLINICALMI